VLWTVITNQLYGNFVHVHLSLDPLTTSIFIRTMSQQIVEQTYEYYGNNIVCPSKGGMRYSCVITKKLII
jgi:hypothetical protein